MSSVRSRLAFLFSALSGVILVVFCASLYFWIGRKWDAEVERDLQVEMKEFAAHFRDEYDETRRGIHSNLGEELEEFCHISGTVVQVLAADGALVYRSTGFTADPADWRIRTRMNGERFRGMSQIVVAPDGREFRVSVAIGEGEHLAHLKQLRLYFAIFVPLALGFGWLIGHEFVRRALAPVETLRLQAEQISRENVSQRVPEPAASGEFKDLARTFNGMLERLDRAFQDLQQFAADAAHELRTPLANLRAQIETSIQQPRSEKDHEQLLAAMSEDVARMHRIITDLFTLAKIDMQQDGFKKERVSIGPLLRETRETWAGVAQERGIRIACSDAEAAVTADPAALRRVFMNLVENAIKYNRDGGTVDLGLERENGTVRVSVKDTGIGIPAEHLPRLFRRFYRVDEGRSRDSGGTGLGLAICKSFTEASGGTIGVTSVVGTGSTFTLEFPAADPIPESAGPARR